MAVTTPLKHRAVVAKGCSHSTHKGHSFCFLSYPALSVSKGQGWENWEMLLPPCTAK